MDLEKGKRMPLYKEQEEPEGPGIDFLVREYRVIRLGRWDGTRI